MSVAVVAYKKHKRTIQMLRVDPAASIETARFTKNTNYKKGFLMTDNENSDDDGHNIVVVDMLE